MRASLTAEFKLAPYRLPGRWFSPRDRASIGDIFYEKRGQTISLERHGSVSQMIVKMRLGGVAAVPTLRQQLPGMHAITAANNDGASTKVREKRKFPAPVVENHVVSKHLFRIHFSRRIVWQLVLRFHNQAVGWSINRLAKTIIIGITLARSPVGLAPAFSCEIQKIVGKALVASQGVPVLRQGAPAPVNIPLAGERQMQPGLRLVANKL